MIKYGKVTSFKNNKVVVSIKRDTACGENCADCSGGCSVPYVNIEADYVEGIEIGDTVEVTTDNINFLKYTLVLYGVPLVIMVTVILVANSIFKGGNGEVISCILGLLSLVVSFFILKIYDRIESKKKKFTYSIIRKVE